MGLYRSGFGEEERSDEKIVFVLDGRRLGGRYVMLKFPKAGKDGWIFFKAD